MKPAISSDDAYLDALEAEAESSSSLKSEPQPEGGDAGQKPSIQESQQQDFERTLKNQLPATFKTYRMLSPEDKLVVVETYFANAESMPKATRVLFQLYFKIK